MNKQVQPRVSRGADLADCIKCIRLLGGKTEPVRRTGEVRFSHPSVEKPVTVNGRRKDAPRQLTTWLNRLVSGKN